MKSLKDRDTSPLCVESVLIAVSEIRYLFIRIRVGVDNDCLPPKSVS
jgi:hypothetical protein